MLILAAAGLSHAAEPARTLISDVVYRADGTPAAGTLLITWPAFTTADGSAVAAGTMSVALGAAGALTLDLVPNQGATPEGTYYKVVLKLSDGTTSTEYWTVPAASPATLAAIRASIVPSSLAGQFVTRSYVDQALSSAVLTTGDQSVNGVKQFTSSPLVPDPVSGQAAASKNYVDLAVASGGSGSGVLSLDKGGTGQSTWTAARCVRVANDGTKLESAAFDCSTGSGDVSSNTSTSVDGEVALFSGTLGKTIKRATGSGMVKLTNGVLGFGQVNVDFLNSASWATPGPIGNVTPSTGAFTTLSLTGALTGTTSELHLGTDNGSWIKDYGSPTMHKVWGSIDGVNQYTGSSVEIVCTNGGSGCAGLGSQLEYAPSTRPWNGQATFVVGSQFIANYVSDFDFPNDNILAFTPIYSQFARFCNVLAGGTDCPVGSGTLAKAAGIYVDKPAIMDPTFSPPLPGAGVTTWNAGLWVNKQTGYNVSNSAAIRIEDQGNGATAWSIYSLGGKNYLAGGLTLGNITGSTQCLHVDASGTISGTGSDCGAGAGGGSTAFNALTSGTNTTAAMLIGTGASLGTTGSGTIAATTANALAANGTNCATGQAAQGIDASGNAEGCFTVTGVDINSSGQVTSTHLSSPLPKSQGGTGSTSLRWSCESGLGDGLNTIPAGTYLQSFCYNDTGSTVTLTGLRCFTDNAGTSTMNASNGSGTALLTGAVTCSPSFASGTQSGTTTLASGDFIKFTFVADGSSKQTTWVVTGTY